jgi:uncharacterized protein (TIGR03437 family)
LEVFSGDPLVRVPESVRTRPHQSSLSFQAAVDPYASGQTVVVQAAADGSIAEDRISVLAADTPVLKVPGPQFVTFGARLSFRVTAAPDSDGAVALSAVSLPPGARFNAATGIFEWTPGPSQSGSWTTTFSATDSAGRSATARVFLHAGSGAPIIDRLRNAASGSSEAVCSVGSLATVEGGWLSVAIGSDSSGKSLELAGTRVLVNGTLVPVVVVSPTQVTFACPDAPVGSVLSLFVATAAGVSAPVISTMQDSALGVFTMDGSANGQAAAEILDGASFAGPRNHHYLAMPAQAGDWLSVPVTGLPKDTDPDSVAVLLGDVQVQAIRVDTGADAIGLTRIGIAIPSAAPVGDSIPLRVQRRLPDGRIASSQTVSIAVEPTRQ